MRRKRREKVPLLSEELGDAGLGDERLNRRLGVLADLVADSGHADRPFRPMPITRSGKAITRGVTTLGRSGTSGSMYTRSERLANVSCGRRFACRTTGGLEISVGHFTLRVTYVDVVEYGDGAEQAIQDPRRALFTLASLVQVNAAALAKLDATVWAEIRRKPRDPVTYLWIDYDVAATGEHVVIRDGPARKDTDQDIVNSFCAALPALCAVKPGPVLDLYECPGAGRCDGLVRFGALPSPEMPTRLALVAPAAGRVKRIRLERHEMTRYFSELQ